MTARRLEIGSLARDGLEDSVDTGRTYFRAVVGDRTDHDLQDAYLNTGPIVVDFLQDTLGIPTRFQAFPDYFDAPGRQEVGRSIYPKPIKGEEVGERTGDIRSSVPSDQFGSPEDTARLEGGRAWVARHRGTRGATAATSRVSSVPSA